jgi:hypothetical protein
MINTFHKTSIITTLTTVGYYASTITIDPYVLPDIFAEEVHSGEYILYLSPHPSIQTF